MRGQLTQLTHLTREVKHTNKFMKAIIFMAAFTLVWNGVLALRMHVAAQRLEQTEVRLITMGKSLEENLKVSRRTQVAAESAQQTAEAVQKKEDERPTLALVADEKKPKAVKVVIVPPKTPMPKAVAKEVPPVKKAVEVSDAGAPEGSTLELPVRLPDNVSVGNK